MPKCGQMRVGASWVGGKEPDLLATGQLRPYDKRCRTRIMIGAVVRGKIAKNSIWRVRHGNGVYGSNPKKKYQEHFKYYDNIGAPGSNLEAWQAVFRQAMLEVKNLTEEQRAPYKAMAKANLLARAHHPGTYKATPWLGYYLKERLPQLYPGYP